MKSRYLSLFEGVPKLQEAALLHLQVCRFTAACCLARAAELREKTVVLLLRIPSTSHVLRPFAIWCQIV